MRLTPGTRVGPYEVVSLLGAGGMAEVYRAKDTRLGRDVALKVVSEALGGDGAFLERFEREAKLAASLAHPNVVALFDVGVQEGKPYFVTELLQGESLRERLAKGAIPLAKALEWAAQMAQGLAAAHERGIVHRDMKPENVFITRDGQVKLLDFGIAKLIETAQAATPHGLMDPTVSPSGSSTRTGMVLGTPGYMSPEQVRGDPVDARTDFFSLGAVLYEMLSGHRAFPAGPAVESGYAILHNEPEALRPTVPAQVAQVVQRCQEKDAARRFQSARDLAFNLELVRTSTGSTAPNSLATAAPPSRWQYWPWLLASALATLGVGTATYFAGRATRLPTPLVQQMTFRRGTVSAARFTSEGLVVYSAAWGVEPEQIFARSAGAPDAQPLGFTGARLLSLSEKGELAVALRPLWFGSNSAGGTLAFAPIAGGAPREVTEGISFADWSHTGELAAVRIVDGAEQLEYPLGKPLFESAGSIAFPRVSPTGDSVAFFHDPAQGPAVLMLAERKGAVRDLLVADAAGLAWAPNGNEVWFAEGVAIWAVSLSGKRRLVYQGVSPMQLEDISRDGKVLVNIQDVRRDVVLVPSEHEPQRELPWMDVVELAAITDDGHRVLFTALPEATPVTYLRPTDGSPPLKLGAGKALALSADGQWALANDGSGALTLLPVGVGTSMSFVAKGFDVQMARLLGDGKRAVVTAQRANDKRWRLYLVPLEGGTPTLLSEAPVMSYYLEVSRDSRFAAASSLQGTLTVFPLDGGTPLPLPELGKWTVPAAWTSDGQLWASDNLTAFRVGPSHLIRYDVRDRRVVEKRTISPTDPTGLAGIGYIFITPDNRTIAFDYLRILGHLYQLDGLASSGR